MCEQHARDPYNSSLRPACSRRRFRSLYFFQTSPEFFASGQVGQPGAEQPTGWRSQKQANDDEGQCHREFVPTALPPCWLAGQSGHAGHGVM